MQHELGKLDGGRIGGGGREEGSGQEGGARRENDMSRRQSEGSDPYQFAATLASVAHGSSRLAAT